MRHPVYLIGLKRWPIYGLATLFILCATLLARVEIPSSYALSHGDVMYVSPQTAGSIAGIQFSSEDILAYDVDTSTWSLYFDGSDVGLSSTNVDAFAFAGDGSLLFSTSTTVSALPGLSQPVEDVDVVRFVASSLGTNTAGTFRFRLDGSDVGLTADGGEDIDAIAHIPGLGMVVSTRGAFNAENVSGDDEDLFLFDPVSWGVNTSGSWALFLDGTALGLVDAAEDVWGVWVDTTTNDVYLSTKGTFTIDGLSGDGTDIFICHPLNINPIDSCMFDLFWDGSASGTGDLFIDAITVVKGSPESTPTPTVTNSPMPSPTNVPSNTPTYTPTSTPLPPNTPSPTPSLPPPGTAVSLHAIISPTLSHAGDRSLTMIVEARDAYGDLATAYRGGIEFDPSVSISGLPDLRFRPDYTFTEADGGRHVFTDFGFNVDGTQTIYIYDTVDPMLETTSNLVIVEPVWLSAVISPTTAFAGEPILALIVEAQDANGNLVPGYRGELDVNPSSSTTGLPQSPLSGIPDYVFSEADGGRHLFSSFAFNAAGSQTITIIDRNDTSRQTTSNAVNIQEIILQAWITPTSSYVYQKSLSLTVEARDTGGNLVPGYRGSLDINPSVPTLGLPQSPLGGIPDYTFTQADAGRHTFSNWGFRAAGNQSIIIVDRADTSRQTTATALIKAVTYDVFLAPNPVIVYDPATLSVLVHDPAVTNPDPDDRITDFYSSIYISSTLSHSYQDTYTFTDEDDGIIQLSLHFNEVGQGRLQVVDTNDPSRRSQPITVTVTNPFVMAPVPPAPPPPPQDIPPLAAPPPIPLSWGTPFIGEIELDSNNWEGKPDQAVPARPGTLYMVQGRADFIPGSSPHWFTFYGCVYLAWENVLTSQRYSGGGLSGPSPETDPAAFVVDGIGCTEAANRLQGETNAWMSPRLAAPAPAGTQGVHMDIAAGGNMVDPFRVKFAANTFLDDTPECDSSQGAVSVGDPIDTRSGAFYLTESDLGLATGCQGVALRFERTYHSLTLGHGRAPLGAGWVHNFELAVTPLNDGYVMVRRPRGSYLLYQDVGSDVYAAHEGVRQRLIKRPGGGWMLLYPDQRLDLFDDQGRLTAQQDANGNLIWMTYETYTYNGKTGSRLARVDAPGERYLWFGYDYYEPYRMILLEDNEGRRVTFSYEETGQLATVTNARGGVATYAYQETYLLTKVDAAGTVVFNNAYDDGGRVVTQINNRGEDLAFTYLTGTDALTTTVRVQPTGAQTTYVYGIDGLLRQVVNPMGASIHYREYNNARLPTRIEDALGYQTRITYDGWGRPIAITDPLSQTTTIAYEINNFWSRPITYTTPLGHSYQFAYDGANLVQITNPAGQTQQFTYTDQGNWRNMLTAITNQAGLAVTLGYNAAGDVSTVSNGRGGLTHLAYNEVGQPAALVDTYGFTTTFQYDQGGQLVRVADPLSGTLDLSYHLAGRVTAVDIAGFYPLTLTYNISGQLAHAIQGERAWHYLYNEQGNLIEVRDPLSRTTRYAYDLAGQVITQTLPGQRQAAFAYDAMGRLLTLTSPGDAVHTLTYTPLGQVASYTMPTESGPAHTLTYEYNAGGQLTQLTYVEGTTVTFGYDDAGRLGAVAHQDASVTYAYDNDIGTLTEIATTDGTTLNYVYEGLLPVAEVWQGPVAGSVQRTYDTGYRLVAEAVNGDDTLSFGYDAAGRLAQAGNLALARDPQTGLLQGTTLGITADNRTYNGYGELVTYQATISETAVLAANYTYDALGRITGKTEVIDGLTTSMAYVYDGVGRLVQVTENGAVMAVYTYDANSNRLSAADANGTVVTATYNAQDQLLTYGPYAYNYTDAGFLQLKTDTSTGKATTYGYDPLGGLRRVTLPDGTEITYVVDGRYRRIGKQVNGVLTQGFLYRDQYEPVAQVDANGQIVARFIYASRTHVPDYIVKEGKLYRMITDHLGSPRLVVDTVTGQIVQRLTYDAFGNVTGDTNPGFQPFGFAGGLYDSDTGLVRFGARDYDPMTGRWTGKDPLGFDGGDTNFYNYVLSDPVNLIDQTGENPLAAMAAGAVVGAGMNILDQLEANDWYISCIDWTEVAIAGGVGAIAGLAGGAFGEAIAQPELVNPSLVPVLQVGGNVLIGAGASLAQSVATQQHQGSINWTQVAVDTIAGGVGGAVGNGFDDVVASALASNRFSKMVSDGLGQLAGTSSANQEAEDQGCRCNGSIISDFIKDLHDDFMEKANPKPQPMLPILLN